MIEEIFLDFVPSLFKKKNQFFHVKLFPVIRVGCCDNKRRCLQGFHQIINSLCRRMKSVKKYPPVDILFE